MARIFLPAVLDSASRLEESVRDCGFDPFDLLGVVLLGIPAVVTVVWPARSALMLGAAVPDLFVREEVEGVVLRIRRHEKHAYLAVDDGARSDIKASLVELPALDGAGLVQGSPVRATVTPRWATCPDWPIPRPEIRWPDVHCRRTPPGQGQWRLLRP